MKKPRIILEWQCDASACGKTVSVDVVDLLMKAGALDDAFLKCIVEASGGALLGRNTFFCPACAAALLRPARVPQKEKELN